MRQNLISDRECGHAVADRGDRPGGLDSERVRWRPTYPPASRPNEVVPDADAGCVNVDDDIGGRDLPRSLEVEDLDRTADGGDASSLHSAARRPCVARRPAARG